MSIQFAEVDIEVLAPILDRGEIVSPSLRQASIRYCIALANMSKEAINLNQQLLRDNIVQNNRLTVGELETLLQGACQNTIDILPIPVEKLHRTFSHLRAYNFNRVACRNLKNALERWSDSPYSEVPAPIPNIPNPMDDYSPPTPPQRIPLQTLGRVPRIVQHEQRQAQDEIPLQTLGRVPRIDIVSLLQNTLSGVHHEQRQAQDEDAATE